MTDLPERPEARPEPSVPDDYYDAVPAAPPLPASMCPGCHHTRRHQRRCELGSLDIEEASLLGYEGALERIRSQAGTRTGTNTGAGAGTRPSEPVRAGGAWGLLRRLVRR